MTQEIDFIGVPTERRNPEPGIVELTFDKSSAYNNPKTTFFPLTHTGKITKIIFKELRFYTPLGPDTVKNFSGLILTVFRPYPKNLILYAMGFACVEGETVTLYGDDAYFIARELHNTNFVGLGGFYSNSLNIAKHIGGWP